jgi:hypothetical protein
MTPVASPNKSWEGSAGGILFALAGALLARWILKLDVPPATALLTARVMPPRGQRPGVLSSGPRASRTRRAPCRATAASSTGSTA